MEILKIYNLIKKQVKDKNLPVITLLSYQKKDPFIILISTVLSLRTKDEITLKASKNLFKKVKKPEDILKLKNEELENLIYPVGFYRVKSKNIKKICKILVEKYNSKVPNNLEDLLKLPGVGRKTANLVLAEGFNIPAICVDIHVHRISNRLGIVDTKNPEDTEEQLKKVLPEKIWIKYNTYLVAFGQSICKPISPLCSKCLLNKKCPKIGVKIKK